MNKTSIKPALETLEDRFLPSTIDVQAFQQQVPQFQAELNAAIPQIQAGLQQFLTSMEQQALTWTPAQQLQVTPLFAEAQWAINNFPALAQLWFTQQVQLEEAKLLAINDLPQEEIVIPPSNNTYYVTNPPGYINNPLYISPPNYPLPPPPLPRPLPPMPYDPIPEDPPEPSPDYPVY